MLQRGVGLLLALLVAFYTFICGLVVLFDRVDATNGHSTRAWVVSLVGLVLSAVIGLGLGALLLKCFVLLRPQTDGSTWLFVLVATAVAAGAVLCVSAVTAGLD
jgi:hypothetical protein